MKPRVIVSVPGPLPAAADPAVARALAFARGYRAVLHVIRIRTSGDERDDRVPGAGVELVTASLSGWPVRVIADHVARVSADLVVMSRTLQESSGYWSAEAFTSAVGRAVKVPTIVVPEADGAVVGDTAPAFRDILVAVDFSQASLRAMTEALLLAQHSGARLRLLHVLNGSPCESTRARSRASRLADDLRGRAARANRQLESLIPSGARDRHTIEVSTVPGDVADSILSVAATPPADLIVLGVPRQSRFDPVMAGSTTERVLRRASVPVLLMPGSRTPRLPSSSEVHEAIRSGWTLHRPLSTHSGPAPR